MLQMGEISQNLPRKSHISPQKKKKILKENVIYLGCDFIFRIIKHIYPTVLLNRPSSVSATFIQPWRVATPKVLPATAAASQ